MNRDEQLKELFKKRWDEEEEELRNPLEKYSTKQLKDELKRRKKV